MQKRGIIMNDLDYINSESAACYESFDGDSISVPKAPEDWRGAGVIVDSSYICNLLFYSAARANPDAFGDLRCNLLDSLREFVGKLRRYFSTEKIVFAADSLDGMYDRALYFPYYKVSRHEYKSEDEERLRENLRKIIREDIPAYVRNGVGAFMHIPGAEADDVIAILTKAGRVWDKVVIVSGDGDMLQLLESGRTCVMKPSGWSIITEETFREEWGIAPSDWVVVKALAGCSSDDIPGVERVGEKTAAKWVRGELKPTTKAARAIEEAVNGDVGDGMFYRNLNLVRLPYPLASWGRV